MKNYRFVSLFLAGLMALSPAVVFAHSNDNDLGVNTKEKTEVKTEGRFNIPSWSKWLPQPIVNTCAATDTRIDKVVSDYDAKTDVKVNAYLDLKTKVADFQTKAAAAGYNTTTLQADMGTLNTKVAKFAADYQAYINSLRVLRTYTCGGSDGQFAAQLVIAKQLLTQARTDATDLRNYYKETIKVDIQNLWKQIAVDYNMSFSL